MPKTCSNYVMGKWYSAQLHYFPPLELMELANRISTWNTHSHHLQICNKVETGIYKKNPNIWNADLDLSKSFVYDDYLLRKVFICRYISQLLDF